MVANLSNAVVKREKKNKIFYELVIPPNHSAARLAEVRCTTLEMYGTHAAPLLAGGDHLIYTHLQIYCLFLIKMAVPMFSLFCCGFAEAVPVPLPFCREARYPQHILRRCVLC